MVLQGRGLLGQGSQLVGLCGAEPGLCFYLYDCKVALDGEGATSMEYVCGWMCQISSADPGEVFPRQGNFLELLIPSLVREQPGHVSQQASSPQVQATNVEGLQSYPDSCLCQVGPDCNLLPGAHVWITVSLESGFQLLELLAGEVCPLPPLLLFERAVFRVGVVRLVLLGFLSVCVRNRKVGQIP